MLSGNRNFEARIHPAVRANYLASPPLVVAYALAGSVNTDLTADPLGEGTDGPVYLRDVWPSAEEVNAALAGSFSSDLFTLEYGRIFDGDERWQELPVPEGELFDWDPRSTYVREATFFEHDADLSDIVDARVLVLLGDSVTTDHISPAGSFAPGSPAGAYLVEQGVEPRDFNSYGARRGNHEVMVRGTFANIRLRNQLAGREGGYTRHLPSGEEMTIYAAAQRYAAEHVPLVAIAGREYGSGSSRDWAAKGTALLGIRAVIAQSFERIHRTNLVALGVHPAPVRRGRLGREPRPGRHRDVHHPRAREPRRRLHRDGRAERRRAVVRVPRPAGRAGRRRHLPRRRPPADGHPSARKPVATARTRATASSASATETTTRPNGDGGSSSSRTAGRRPSTAAKSLPPR